MLPYRTDGEEWYDKQLQILTNKEASNNVARVLSSEVRLQLKSWLRREGLIVLTLPLYIVVSIKTLFNFNSNPGYNLCGLSYLVIYLNHEYLQILHEALYNNNITPVVKLLHYQWYN